ncbi:MAG: FKBP-type peptidyl-prolyl cis-trans isomerase, partial [Anaerolineae bacterium]
FFKDSVMNAACLALVSFLSFATFLFADQTVKSQASQENTSENIARISEAFGHLIGKNIENLGIKFDIDAVVKGIQDSSKGIESPMSEVDCVQAISVHQEANFKGQAAENLKKAEAFMSQNASANDVITIEKEKLQYKIDRAGEGAVVQEHFSPLIRYTGKFLDGKVFGTSKEDELISLDETIPGFSKGLLGMREGEKRTLYIHPDLGYGTQGYLPPNSLLTFEIELVKANAPQLKETESLTSTSTNTKAGSKDQVHSEIASPENKGQVIR